MTVFLLICAVMSVAAVIVIVRPLLRRPPDEAGLVAEKDPVAAAVLIVAIPLIATGLYFAVSNWQWNRPPDPQQAAIRELQKQVTELEKHLRDQPTDVDGWLALGRAYVRVRRFDRGVDAYQRAYDLTRGENIDALIGLGEALTLTDEKSLVGRAGELFEEAARRAPRDPKVLWYSSLAALNAGNLPLARERMQLMLAQNPPQEIRGILEREIQDLDQQLATPAGGVAAAAQGPASAASVSQPIKVSVTLAPALANKVPPDMALFVLAREPGGGGPPLAAVRRTAKDLPLSVQLSEQDAMIPGRSIAGKATLQIVARLSRGGQPVAQSGDFYGEAQYSSAGQGGALNIEINKTVP